MLGCRVVIVMPLTTPEIKVDAVRRYGAEVILYGESFSEAHDYAHELEKLRKSFEKYLPEEVAWRRKDGFSDGVSKNDRPWYQIINEYTQKKFGMNEKEYYMSIFQKYYKNNEKIIPYEWLPKWCDQSNPSGRLILNQ